MNILLSLGAQTNVRDVYGSFPLLLAIRNNHLDICQALISAGADVNFKTFQGETALHHSCSQGFWEESLWLLKNGASLLRCSARNETAIFNALKHPKLLREILVIAYKGVKNNKEGEPMGSNDSSHRVEFNRDMSALLRVVCWKNEDGHNILHRCIDNECSQNQIVGVQSLDVIIDVVSSYEPLQQRKKSFLSLWSRTKETTLEMLMKDKDINGDTPLHIAVRKGNEMAIERILFSTTCALNVENDAGNTPLQLAISLYRPGIMKMLAKHRDRKSMRIKNSNGESLRKMWKFPRKRESSIGISCAKSSGSEIRDSDTFKFALRRSPTIK